MGDLARFGEHGFGKDARQLMLADHHLHVDAEVVGRAEDFNDAADGRARGRGPTGDLDIDDEAVKVAPGFRVLDVAACFAPSTRCGVDGFARRAEFPRREESRWAASCGRRRE